MCGIAGLLQLEGNLHPGMIRLMTDPIRHRGPDDEGFLVVASDAYGSYAVPYGGSDTPHDAYASSFPHLPARSLNSEIPGLSNRILALLGHRRLSIVDPSAAGHQPMCVDNQKIWITYNGEVFNYLDIRRQLEEKGYRFYSNTDTEVVLRAYDHWGIDCLHQFNGMFAFLIVDLKRKKAFAARDRFGVKPLYMWRSPQGFLAFGSEIKQFMPLAGWASKANIPLAMDYLLYGMTDFSHSTMFDGVQQVCGGQYIECALDSIAVPDIKTWYRLEKKPIDISFQESAKHFYDLFEDSVRLRLRSDVDIGSCLSGGLDSSSIVCMADRLLNRMEKRAAQKTFSACSHIARFDERSYMDAVISHTGAEGCFIIPAAEDVLKMAKTVVWHQDEPFGSSSIFAQYLVFSLAKQANVKVMLDGQGSDEYLAGYPFFWNAHLAQLTKQWNMAGILKEVESLRQNGTFQETSQLGVIKQLIPGHWKHLFKKLLWQMKAAPFSHHWINFHRFPEARPHSFSRDELDIRKEWKHLVDALSFEQLTRTSLPALLRYEDRNSMAHSIEARTPFLDYRLVEFCFNLPAAFKIGEGHTKRILREALKGLLPEKVHKRTDKLGFATAEEVWMCQEKPKEFKQAVSDAVEKSQGFLNAQAIALAEDILQRRLPFNWVLWRMINFGYWIETFDVKL